MNALLLFLIQKYNAEPARVHGLIAAAVVALLLQVGVVDVDAGLVATVVGAVVPLLAAELTRRKVTPVDAPEA